MQRNINKGFEYQWNFFAVSGNGPTLLGMPDCECLKLLSINCQVTNDLHIRRQVNKQTKEDKSKPNNITKDNPCTNNKTY